MGAGVAVSKLRCSFSSSGIALHLKLFGSWEPFQQYPPRQEFFSKDGRTSGRGQPGRGQRGLPGRRPVAPPSSGS